MPRILELMAEKTPGEFEAQDPLEQLLDEESDEEFGLPEFREHLADSLTPAVLKDWTAADFASIYVRFRPHLERHAKRFLVNPSQVEEVVQDAFLYLMTTLPELDSELGVLKFLKWKTRLLALDVIRANSRVSFAPLDEQPEIAAKVDEFSLELERADDAAIVALALAKLQPRHREALIATLYEEKASEVVAAQMGLNENAFRQLLFRARSAFKKALVGEAETAGLRVSEILSIAARKAAKESGKYISAAGAFLLVLAISIGVLPNLSQPAQEQIAAPVPAVTSSEAPVTQEQLTESENQIEPAPQDEVNEVLVEEVESTSVQQVQLASSQVAGTTTVAAASVEAAGDSAVETDGERLVLESFLMDTLNGDAIKSLSRNTSGQVVSNSQGLLTLSNGSGLTANVAYNLNTEQGIQYTWFSLDVDGLEFAAVPQVWHAEKKMQPNGSQLLTYIATDLLVGDMVGNFRYIASDDSAVSTGAVRMEILISESGQVLSSSLYLTARS
jgi:RNA polymerase sigma-70 factor (ECF subfamily)